MAAATAAMMMSVSAARPWNGVLPTRPSSDNVNSVLSFLIVNIAEVGDGAGTPPRGGKSLIREMNADRSHRTRNILGRWRWRWRWAPDKVINNKKQAPPK